MSSPSSTNGKDKPRTNQLIPYPKLALALAMGTVFGMAIERSSVFEPSSIRGQMLFQKWIMMKMFLSAVGTGSLSFALLSGAPGAREAFAATHAYATSTTLGLGTTALGGALLGVGMTVSGACPGMVLAQVGAGVPSALYTLAGCLTGALVYGLAQPYIPSDGHTLFKHGSKPSSRTLNSYFGLPFAVLTGGFGLFLFGGVFVLETLVPWQSELPPAAMESLAAAGGRQGVLSYFQVPWSPVLAGVLVGLLQIPSTLALRRPIGSSSSYVTVVAQLVPQSACDSMECLLLNMKRGPNSWWQVAYVTGAVLGALFTSTMSGTRGDATGLSPVAGFVGGAILVGGSRLAGGCTSGHGLSGMANLSLPSFVAVAAMFAGGMSVAFGGQAVGMV